MSEELLVVGRITKAHGLKGDLVVRPASEGSDVLLQLGHVVLGREGRRERREVVRAKVHGGQILLAFEGALDRTAAEALVGAEVLIRRDELPPPAEDEYYVEELKTFTVESPSGASLGRVLDLESSGGHHWLDVEGPQGRGLVPFSEPLVRIDRKSRRIVIDAPEGLFEAETEK